MRLPGERLRGRVDAVVVLGVPRREDDLARPSRRCRFRSSSSLKVAAGGFSRSTLLPASSASRAMSWRTCGGVQIATASRSGSFSISR